MYNLLHGASIKIDAEREPHYPEQFVINNALEAIVAHVIISWHVRKWYGISIQEFPQLFPNILLSIHGKLQAVTCHKDYFNFLLNLPFINLYFII